MLSTTWLVPGQPPQTTQTAFTSMAKCEAARQQTVQAGVEARADVVQLNAAARQEVKQHQAEARAEAEARFGPGVILGASPADIEKLKGQPLPTVSAVCVQQ